MCSLLCRSMRTSMCRSVHSMLSVGDAILETVCGTLLLSSDWFECIQRACELVEAGTK